VLSCEYDGEDDQHDPGATARNPFITFAKARSKGESNGGKKHRATRNRNE
jgi:hypothetical protein